jgi:hypothetical protein
MNKAQLIENAVVLGLDASGTKQQIKDRLEAYRLLPKAVTSADIVELPERKAYRMGSKLPKVRKIARNLQVKADD